MADLGVEKRQRHARLDRFDPKRHAAELHGQFVLVHAVDAMRNDLAERVSVFRDRRRSWISQVGKPLRDAARGAEDEVSGSARRVDRRQP